MSMISNLNLNRDRLNEVLFSLAKEEKKRELSLVLTKVEEAIMWLDKAIYLAQPTLFDNVPHQENPNQGRLFDDNGHPVIVHEEPKEKKTRKARETRVEVVQQHTTAQEALEAQPKIEEVKEQPVPTKEEVIFMAKEYSKKHTPDAFLKVLETFGATKISEVYAKGNTAVFNLVEAIRV